MTTLPSLDSILDNGLSEVGGGLVDRIQKQWPELAPKLRHRWRKLTDDDVACPNGSSEYLASVLQERYGVDRREALLQVFEFECEL